MSVRVELQHHRYRCCSRGLLLRCGGERLKVAVGSEPGRLLYPIALSDAALATPLCSVPDCLALPPLAPKKCRFNVRGVCSGWQALPTVALVALREPSQRTPVHCSAVASPNAPVVIGPPGIVIQSPINLHATLLSFVVMAYFCGCVSIELRMLFCQYFSTIC